MNVIVKKHYPVEKLPADLREGLDADTSLVTIEIAMEGVNVEDREPAILKVEDAVLLMRKMQRENTGRGVTEAEAVARIRELRDDDEA